MECSLCKYFDTGAMLTALWPLCDECQTWLMKILGVRRRYRQMIKEMYDN